MSLSAVRSRCRALEMSTIACHERGAKRVGLPEGVPGALLAAGVEEDFPVSRGDPGRLEGCVQLPPGVLVLGLEQALVDDRGQVAVVEPYVIEPAVPVLERVEEASDLVAGGGLADQVAQVALAGDEADHRGGTLGFAADSMSLETFCASRETLVGLPI